jgi:hypothetical protein
MTQSEINPAAEDSRMEYKRAPVYRVEHREGSITRIIEEQTAKIPSNLFLIAALGSMAVAAILEYQNKLRFSRFIGQWPAPLLIMGVYNKIVKSLGPN